MLHLSVTDFHGHRSLAQSSRFLLINDFFAGSRSTSKTLGMTLRNLHLRTRGPVWVKLYGDRLKHTQNHDRNHLMLSCPYLVIENQKLSILFQCCYNLLTMQTTVSHVVDLTREISGQLVVCIRWYHYLFSCLNKIMGGGFCAPMKLKWLVLTTTFGRYLEISYIQNTR